jgi:glycosyltransferase involved in cell wall biosynthesis
MRVLFVTQDDFSKPSEMHILGFAEELARRGHAVMISLGGDPTSAEREGISVPTSVDLHKHRFVGPRLARSTREFARAFAPDVIHAWVPNAQTMSVALAYSRVTGSPYVVHFEDDYWRPWPRPAHSSWMRLRLAGQRSAWRIHPPVWIWSTPMTLRWAQSGAAAVDALSPALVREVQDRLGRECSLVLPVMPSRSVQDGLSAVERRGDERVVLFTGRIMATSLPDFDCAIRAVARVRQQGLNARLVQTGTIDPDLDVRAVARTHGLEDAALSLLGHLPFADIAPTLRGADVLIQPGPPSRFNRLRLPSKLQSYLESGTPTITFSVGIGELLKDGEEVAMTYTADPDELADCLMSVLTDEDLRKRLNAGGREAANRLFDRTRNTDRLLEYYRSALGGDFAQGDRLRR